MAVRSLSRIYSELAKEVLDNSLGVKSGERVWVQSWDHTLDLAQAFASECSSRRCPILLTVRYEDNWLQSILRSSKGKIGRIDPLEKSILEETDFFIFTMGPRTPLPWNSVPKQTLNQVSVWLDTRYDKSLYARRWERIAKANKIKMLAVEATLATPERAEANGLNYEEWREIMLSGCVVDHRMVSRRAKKLASFMSRDGKLSVTTAGGTQLACALTSRTVGISDGVSTNEMAKQGRIVFLPAGAVEVSIDEESAIGRIAYDAPVRLGSENLDDLVLELEHGQIVRHWAKRDSRAFRHYLGQRNSARLSYFGFGLNPNLQHGFTQDDKVLGGLTLGFGDNRSMGGKNAANGQWWASIRGATVTLDNTELMVRGRLTI